jgi:hypothetical protein
VYCAVHAHQWHGPQSWKVAFFQERPEVLEFTCSYKWPVCVCMPFEFLPANGCVGRCTTSIEPTRACVFVCPVNATCRVLWGLWYGGTERFVCVAQSLAVSNQRWRAVKRRQVACTARQTVGSTWRCVSNSGAEVLCSMHAFRYIHSTVLQGCGLCLLRYSNSVFLGLSDVRFITSPVLSH